MEIFYPILTLAGLGLFFGLGLAFASRKFCVAHDKRVDEIREKLPGSNCGACGTAGCIQFAEKLIDGSCTITSCPVSSDESKKDIARILGQQLDTQIKRIAILHCNGGKKVKDKFEYDAVKDCVAANLLGGGQKACVYGCLGFGSCARACKFDALIMGPDGLPCVDEAKCIACGACVRICPKNLFSLEVVDKKYYVACSSQDSGKDVMKVCKVGCIACRKCQINCPVKAIVVIDNLARFDYDKCDNLGKCLEVCPTKVIKRR